MFFLLLSLFGCGLDPIAADTGRASIGELDRGESVDFLVYPTNDQNEIFIFSGHGGKVLPPFSAVRTAWESDGWTVRQDDVFPQSLQSFRLIVFVDTGAEEEAGSHQFSPDELDALGKAVDRGTRLLFLQNRQPGAQCGTEIMTQIFTEWAIPFAFDQGLPGEEANRTLIAVNESTQAMAQVETVTMRRPCTLTTGGTWLVRSESEHATISQYRPGNAGDLIVAGDVDVLRDTLVDPEVNDNLLFAQNLAWVTP